MILGESRCGGAGNGLRFWEMKLHDTPNPPRLPAGSKDLRFMPDEDLIAQCRVEFYRTPGPGGQKRNKTSSAVRMTHIPTGLVATSSEWRTQSENRLFAMRRLRMKIATDLRREVDLMRFEPPDWFLAEVRRGDRMQVSHRHPYFAPTAGLVLDLLKALGGNPAGVATNLGVSTSAVVKMLEDEPQLWAAANRIRADLGLIALTHRR
jgi:hypothetical protein